MKFLIYTSDMDAFETALVNRGWGSFETVDEELQIVNPPYPVLIDGQAVNVTRQETFLASTIKGWTLPNTITRSVPVVVNGVSQNRDMEFVVDNLSTFTRERQNWISFTVNGIRYEARDAGGRNLVPASNVAVFDFNANGWPLVNKKGVYDTDGTQISAPEVIPGTFVVLEMQDDIDGQTVIDFFLAGTQGTYSRTAAQTDWGEGYTITYWSRDTASLVDPATLPAEIIAQHGKLQSLQPLT